MFFILFVNCMPDCLSCPFGCIVCLLHRFLNLTGRVCILGGQKKNELPQAVVCFCCGGCGADGGRVCGSFSTCFIFLVVDGALWGSRKARRGRTGIMLFQILSRVFSHYVDFA